MVGSRTGAGPGPMRRLLRRSAAALNRATGADTCGARLLGEMEAGLVVWREGVAYANPAAAALFGRPSPAALATVRTPDELFAAECLPALAALLEACRADPAHRGACKAHALRPDGSRFRLLVRARATQWQGKAGVLLTCVEIEPEAHGGNARAQPHLFQTVLDQIPHPVYVKALDGRYLIVNRSMAEFRGMTVEELTGRTAEDVPTLSPEVTRALLELDRRALEAGGPVEEPALLLTRVDGQRRWRHIIKTPLRDEQQRVVGVIGVSMDITESHRAVQKLRDQRELLQAVFDALPVWVSVKDRDLRYVMVNASALADTGLTESDYLGTHTADLPLGKIEEMQRNAELDREVLATGQRAVGRNHVHTLADGTRHTFEHIKVPYRGPDGEIQGIVTVSLDNTARLAAEAERVRMAAALEQAGDAVFMTDLDGRIDWTNAAFERLTGYTRAEAHGKTPRLLKSGRHPHGFYADLWATLLRGEVFTARYVNRRKDGTAYHTRSTHSPIRDPDGRVTGYLGVQRDVTREVELEEQLLRAQRMESLGTLAGGIAHDFNNLLMPILGYTELLWRRTADDSEEAGWLRLIAEAGQRARDLVLRILLFSRRADSERAPMQLGDVVREVLGLLQHTVPPSIRLETELGEEGWLMGDAAQMHQVLMNLCVNAVQAMPDGGTLTISLDVRELDGLECYLGHVLSGRFVRLSVADTGVGMDADTLSHIFEPFFTTKELGKGTGLGLSTVFGIVRSHQGALRIHSTPGAGTRFELYFPETVPASSALAAAPERDLPGSERVLVVDDEPAIAELMELTLSELGYRVTALTDSCAAAALLDAGTEVFEALVVDQNMPGLSGHHLARHMRTRHPGAPILLCSGLGEESLPDPGGMDVVDARLRKPFRPMELANRLRSLLDGA